MRKLKISVLALLATIGLGQPVHAQEVEEKKLSRAERKALQQQIDSIQYEQAIVAMRDTAFTLEASYVVFKHGYRAFVHSHTNFVRVEKNKAIVQVAFNVPVAGPNGIGGVTVEGLVSDYRLKYDKRGCAYLTFYVQGVGISAHLSISLPKGTNNASLTVMPNFNSRRLTFEGVVLPTEESFVVKGRSL